MIFLFRSSSMKLYQYVLSALIGAVVTQARDFSGDHIIRVGGHPCTADSQNRLTPVCGLYLQLVKPSGVTKTGDGVKLTRDKTQATKWNFTKKDDGYVIKSVDGGWYWRSDWDINEWWTGRSDVEVTDSNPGDVWRINENARYKGSWIFFALKGCRDWGSEWPCGLKVIFHTTNYDILSTNTNFWLMLVKPNNPDYMTNDSFTIE